MKAIAFIEQPANGQYRFPNLARPANRRITSVPEQTILLRKLLAREVVRSAVLEESIYLLLFASSLVALALAFARAG